MKTYKKSLISSIIALTLLALLGGCGSGGTAEESIPSGIDQSSTQSFFSLTSEEYSFVEGNYLVATNSQIGLVLRYAIAKSMTDPDFATVLRIDIPNPAVIVAGTTYSLGAGDAAPFPGRFYFFNGQPSTLLRTVSGNVTFTSYGVQQGDLVSGNFVADMVDGGDVVQKTYSVAGNFSFVVGKDGVAIP